MGASGGIKSRLPPSGSSAIKTGGVRKGISGLHTRPKVAEAAPIRVPKKSYNLNNLGPDAYPDGEMPSNSFVTGGNGADGLIECYNCGRSFNEQAIGKHENICKKVFSGKRKVFNMAKQRMVDNN